MITFVTLLGAWLTVYAADVDVKEIIRVAEDIRSPDQAESSVTLTTVENGKSSEYRMRVLRSTLRRAFIDFLAPDTEKGRRMLAQGNRYWSTFPSSKRVVAISRKEMIGNSAFGVADVFQMDVDTEYDAKLLGEESQLGKVCLKLELTGKNQDAAYDRIIYWVEKKGYYPVIAKFFSRSGQLLKTMTVGAPKLLAGRDRPESLIMTDEVVVGRQSTWQTLEMQVKPMPDAIFTKEHLKDQ